MNGQFQYLLELNILRRSNSSLTPDHLSSSHDSTTSGNNPTTNAPSYGNDPISDTPSYSYDPFTDAPSSHEGTNNTNNQSITSESGNVDSDTTDSSNNPTTNAPLHTHTQYQSSPDGINAWSTITLDHSSLSNNASDVFSSVRTTIPSCLFCNGTKCKCRYTGSKCSVNSATIVTRLR